MGQSDGRTSEPEAEAVVVSTVAEFAPVAEAAADQPESLEAKATRTVDSPKSESSDPKPNGPQSKQPESDKPESSTKTGSPNGEVPKAAEPTEEAKSENIVNTLLTGASLQNTWRMQSLSEATNEAQEAEALENAPENQPENQPQNHEDSGVHSRPDERKPETAQNASASVVIQVAAQVLAAEPQTPEQRSAALADTQLVPKLDPARRAATKRKLGRTLRMEIGLAKAAIANAVSGGAQPSAAKDQSGSVRSGATQRIGTNNDSDSSSERNSARATDPFGRQVERTRRNPQSAFPPNRATLPPPLPGRTPVPGNAARSISAPPPSGRSNPPAWAARSLSPSPKRPPRLGDKTMIIHRRQPWRDWAFIGGLVAALGITASMLFSYRSTSREQSEAEAEDETADGSGVERTVNAAQEPPQAQGAQTAKTTTPSAQAKASQPPAAPLPANVTEILSTPGSAEVVFGGAVIGNTPVRVARASFDADYLVRLPGHDPQLVRVTANSPSTIMISLKPVAH